MISYLDGSPSGTTSHKYKLVVEAIADGSVGPPSQTVDPPALHSSMAYNWDDIEENEGVLRASWTAETAPGVQVYLRVFKDGATPPILHDVFALSDGGYSIQPPEGGFASGTVYAYRARGLGTGVMAAADHGTVTIHRLSGVTVTLKPDSLNLTLSASWVDVDPSVEGLRYQIFLNDSAKDAPQTGLSYDLTSALTASAADQGSGSTDGRWFLRAEERRHRAGLGQSYPTLRLCGRRYRRAQRALDCPEAGLSAGRQDQRERVPGQRLRKPKHQRVHRSATGRRGLPKATAIPLR